MPSNKKIAVNKFKDEVVPLLRQMGFKGSFPHFRRFNDNKIDLLSVEFDKYGGGYRIGLSQCPNENIRDILNNEVEPDKTTVWHFGDRYVSNWFRYDTANEDTIQGICHNLALKAIEFLDTAQQYWEGKIKQRQNKLSILKWKIMDFFFVKTLN